MQCAAIVVGPVPTFPQLERLRAGVVQRSTRGLLRRLPVDGLQVGRDAAGTVGDYTSPFPFKGKIGEVSITLAPRN